MTGKTNLLYDGVFPIISTGHAGSAGGAPEELRDPVWKREDHDNDGRIYYIYCNGNSVISVRPT